MSKHILLFISKDTDLEISLFLEAVNLSNAMGHAIVLQGETGGLHVSV